MVQFHLEGGVKTGWEEEVGKKFCPDRVAGAKAETSKRRWC